ncbi:MAG: ATP-binding protein [Pseudomonadota bacterium]
MTSHRARGRAMVLGLLLILPQLGAAASADTAIESWVTLRQQPTESLEQQASVRTGAAQVRARLMLADRALNQSAAHATAYLQQAEAGLSSADARTIAGLLRCQLEHRRGEASAAQSCGIARQPVPGDDFVQAYWHWTRAYLAYREGEHEQSLSEATQVTTLAERLGDLDLIAQGHNMIGLHYSTRLRPRMALPHFDAAWQASEGMQYPAVRHMVQLNLGSNYTYLGRPGEALELFREANEAQAPNIYPTRQLIAQSMVAQAQAAIGETEGAEAQLRAVIDTVRDKVLPDALTFGYMGLGKVQLAEGNPQGALESFDKILVATGQVLPEGVEHSRIQLMVVPYARALRQSGDTQGAIDLLNAVIAAIPAQQPDQLLVNAYSELATACTAAGDTRGATRARAQSALLQQQLWDESFHYRVARLNSRIDAQRQTEAAASARERAEVQAQADSREAQLRWQAWLILALLVASGLLFYSRRIQQRLALAERAVSDRLEEQVLRRTADLEDEMAQRLQVEADRRALQIQLAEAEKLRAFGQMSAGVAHDFNNLLTVVSLAADQLRTRDEEHLTQQDRQSLDSIEEASESGRRITNGLMAYARKQPMRPQAVRLDDYVRSTLPLFTNTLGEHFEIRTALAACTVRVDPGQLTTAILNLLLNAREAMAGGGVVDLTVSVVKEQAWLAVRDPGCGMAEDARTRAVEPFFTTKTAGEGTGLGLSMVQGFSKQSGGDLDIESIAGQGTQVTIKLPLHAGITVSESGEVLSEPEPVGELPILIVEDRSALRKVLQKTLVQLGHQVRTAEDAADALAQIEREGPPRLLISDIVMPGTLNGPALADHLQARYPGLAVLLISGYSDDYRGGHSFLRKPFSAEDLERAIARALQPESDGPSPESTAARASA